MVHVEEITDDVAEKLRVSQGSQDASQTADLLPGSNQPTPSQDSAVAGPALSEARATTANMSVDEVWADLQKSPFFMTELQENDDVEALRALAYEGTPLEVASGFKEQGNECFREKRWNDAKEFYGKGVLVIVVEERKRAGLPVFKSKAKEEEVKLPSEKEDDGKVAFPPEEEEKASPEEVEKQRIVLESLYVNRAACHLELRNYRSCWLDGAAALQLNPKNVKACYRSAKALLAVGRIEEADDACAQGLAIDDGNAALRAVARDIIKRNEEITAKKNRENQRIAKEKRRELLLKAALKARGIKTRATAQPPEMEDAKLQLVPDPDDPTSSPSFPTVLLYPADLESDFIKAFNEQQSLADHLSYVFPLPWDKKGEYTLAGVECYLDTVSGGLIKVGKKAPLLKVLSSDKVEVIDEVVRFFVLPKAKAESWVQEYKRKKAAERGS
ncbi:hypothetical protein BJ170DRAFT_239792 [Xylariales sp. AK1849]|nr:hypothetical protein BJ170DRAFT_239792 [Xylariales sp. AK1849]